MVDHGRSWPGPRSAMAGSVADHGRSWPTTDPAMVGHGPGHDRSWSTMTAAMTGHGRPWPVIVVHGRSWSIMTGSVVDHGGSWPVMAAAMVDHDRVRGRPRFVHLLPFMTAFMADHDRVHGRSWRSWPVPWSAMVDHGRSWPVMTGHGCRHGLCNYLSFIATIMVGHARFMDGHARGQGRVHDERL